MNCPQCQTPTEAKQALLFTGQVAILMECDYWHQTVEYVPVSRFNPGLNAAGYDELVKDADIAFKTFLSIAKGELSDLDTPEFRQWKRYNDIADEYYEAW